MIVTADGEGTGCELAGALADLAWLRGVLVVGLLLALVTLLVRIGSDVVSATRP